MKAARQAGLSLNDYIESIDDTPRERRHRDRIVAATCGRCILEIGIGPGRFLEKMS